MNYLIPSSSYSSVILLIILVFHHLSAVKTEDIANNNNNQNEAIGDGDTLKLDERGTFLEKLTSGRNDYNNNGRRSIHSNAKNNKNDFKNEDDNNNEDVAQRHIKEIIKNFMKRFNQHQKPIYYGNSFSNKDSDDDKITAEKDSDEIKSTRNKNNDWTLIDAQRGKHPYDERKGWVNLEPIPWSVSKISRWKSKYPKPSTENPWENFGAISSSQKPSSYHHYDYDNSEEDGLLNRPISITPPSPYHYPRPSTEFSSSVSADRYDTFYEPDRNYYSSSSPSSSSSYPRPSSSFGQKVHHHIPESTGRPSSNQYHHSHKYCQHAHPYEEIITDGRPSNFPHQHHHQQNGYDSFKRRGSTEDDPKTENHQTLNGEGEWILLSTTKGYRPGRPKQRSLSFDVGALGSSGDSSDTQTIRTSRGVRLTVLPPLKGSNINMTTSHGGLLQVDSTFESVDEAKQKFDKNQTMLKAKKKKRKDNNKKNINLHHHDAIEDNSSSSRRNAQEISQFSDPSAVMAAVGAGMIPATMAMMVPLAISG